MIGNSSIDKDGFQFTLFASKNDDLHFLRTVYVIGVRGIINLLIYINRRDEAIRFMEKLHYEINRIDKLTVALVVDCFATCTNEMENSPNKDEILKLLALYM